MIITLIEKQKQNSNKYNIYIDGKYAFSASIDEINYFEIKEGDSIDNEQYKYYVNYFLAKSAEQDTIKFLSIKMLTEYELLEKLKLKEYPVDIINKVISKCKEYKYIDDNSYAKLYIEQKKNQLYSRYRIYNELKKKGITEDIISANLNSIYTDEISVIKKIVTKKFKNIKDNVKIKAYLYRNGFQIDNINAALDEQDI